MPALLHTPLPDVRGHAAERAFLERLVELGDDCSEVWGNVDYLQGVGDIDTILLQPDIGMFTIEVKGVSLDMIEVTGSSIARSPAAPAPIPSTRSVSRRWTFGTISAASRVRDRRSS